MVKAEHIVTTQLTPLQTPSAALLDTQAPASSGSANSAGSAQESFEQELASAFTSALEQLGINASDFSINATSAGSTRQISVTLSEPATNSPLAPASNAAPAAAAAAPAVGPAAADDAPVPSAKYPILSPDKLTLPPNAADDAYWSQQPQVVQQLRYMPNESDRQKLAQNLAGQGYMIDVPVMVWGWDAGETMALRQSYGYTWVPSANNAPIQEAPGFNLPGLVAYNPNTPPAGSILVPTGATEG